MIQELPYSIPIHLAAAGWPEAYAELVVGALNHIENIFPSTRFSIQVISSTSN